MEMRTPVVHVASGVQRLVDAPITPMKFLDLPFHGQNSPPAFTSLNLYWIIAWILKS